MNVLYDISNLGYGHKDAKHRTGIARVIESLAYALVASGECALTFCAQQYSKEAGQYVQANPALHSRPFAARAYKHWITDRYDALNRAGTALSPARRVVRKSWYVLDRTVGQSGRPFTASALAGADVYHSTFQPLPAQVKRARLSRLLTVYDLIPILHPQYYGEDGTGFYGNFLRQVVCSLGPEDYALCISDATKRDLCDYARLDPARAIVTPLAADPAVFYPVTDTALLAAVRRKYSLPQDTSYLLSLSTLEPRKNIEHIIRCFVRLVQEQNIPDLCLVLAGSKGWEYDRIFAELDAAPGVKDRIIVTGRVEDDDLAALYSGALAFAYMSHYEGFGLPPLEAMQCGVPVITSNTSSLPEVVGDAAIMLDPTDADGLCQSLLSLYQNEPLRRTMAKQSLERAALFSWERCARETIAAYKLAMAPA